MYLNVSALTVTGLIKEKDTASLLKKSVVK